MLTAIKSGAWLSRERVARVAVVSAIAGAAMLLFLLATTHGTVDAFGRPLGTDFSVFWNAGHLANGGRAAEAWNPVVLNATAHSTHHADVGDSAWLYPPLFMLVASLLALLPYVAALIAWQVVSLAAIGAALWAITRDRTATWVGLASPLTPMVLAHGQNAFLTAALLGGGLALLARRPMAAGGMLGALAYKPQLGLLLAPLLLITRNWKAMAAAIIVVAALCVLTLILWGPAAWHAFFASVRLGRGFMEQGSVGFYKSASLFAMVRQWGASIAAGYSVQALGAVAGLVLLWRLRDAEPFVRAAGTCAGLAMSTPYLLDYDMAIVGIGAAFLFATAARDGFLDYEKSALAFIWVAPWFARPAAQWLALPLGPAAIVVLALVALRRGRLTASPSRHSRAASAR